LPEILLDRGLTGIEFADVLPGGAKSFFRLPEISENPLLLIGELPGPPARGFGLLLQLLELNTGVIDLGVVAGLREPG
jgi:hypothetical protein